MLNKSDTLQHEGQQTLTLDFRKPKSAKPIQAKRAQARSAPINYHSRSIQIRLMIVVGVILIGFTLIESLIFGRGIFSSSSAVPNSIPGSAPVPVETRLPAKPPRSAEELSVISLPISAHPWQESSPPTSTDFEIEADFWKKLFDSLPFKQKGQLQAVIRFAARETSAPLGTSDRAELLANIEKQIASYEAKAQKELTGSQTLSLERREEFRQALEKVMLPWREKIAPALTKALKMEPTSGDERIQLRLIDQKWQAMALDEVEDDKASPSGDFVAWFGLFDTMLQDENSLKDAHPVSYSELFDQSAQLRGKPIQITGEIRAAEYQKARPNLYGIEGYYVCWVRPENYTDAPIKFFSLALPSGDSVKVDIQSVANLVGRKCELKGFFYKRMAYRAQDDVRAVPTVLCANVAILPAKEPEKGSSDSVGLGMLLLLVGIIGAVLFLIFAFSDRKRVRPQPGKFIPPPTPNQET